MAVVRELVNVVSFRENPSASSEQVEQSIRGIRNTAKKLLGGLIGFGAVVGGIGAVTNRFDQMEKQLITLLGTQEKAQKQMKKLEKFASETPFAVEESIQSFIKLQQVGINASMERLQAFGDAAAAQGASFTKFTESLRKASLGARESLKENFGIIVEDAGKDGRVAVQYEDMRKEVEDDSEAIATAVQQIAEEKFAGGMARQLETIGAQVILLRDNFMKFVRDIGRAGVVDELQEFVDIISEASGEVDVTAESIGESLAQAMDRLNKAVEAGINGWNTFAGAMGGTDNLIWGIITAFQIWMGLQAVKFVGQLALAFRALATTITLAQVAAWASVIAIGAAIVAILAIIEDVTAFAQGKKSVIGKFLEPGEIDEKWKSAAEAIGAALIAIAVGVAIAFNIATGGIFLIVAVVIAAIAAIWAKWDSIYKSIASTAQDIKTAIITAFWDAVVKVKNFFQELWEKWAEVKDMIQGELTEFTTNAKKTLAWLPGVSDSLGSQNKAARQVAGATSNQAAMDFERNANQRKNETKIDQVNVEVPKAENGTPEEQAEKTNEAVQDALENFKGGAL